MWVIREKNEDDSAFNQYVGKENLFTMELHYGGSFHMQPTLEYCNGNVAFVDNVDVSHLNQEVILSILRVLCVDTHEPLFVHFVLPGISLEKGLIPLDCPEDYKIVARFVVIVGQIQFFVEHGASSVNNHGRSPIPDYLAEDGFLISPELWKIQKSPSLKASCSRQLTFDLNEPLHGEETPGNVNQPCLDMVLYNPATTEGVPAQMLPLDSQLWEVQNLSTFQADVYDPVFTFNLEDTQY